MPCTSPVDIRTAEHRYVTIGTEFADAYSGVPLVPQAASEAKDPFSAGLQASSRHRGRQFATAGPKSGQSHKSFSSFVTVSAGDPYSDKWKLLNRHYQRSAPTAKALDKVARRGILVAGGAEVQHPPHMAAHGHTVSIPTRIEETHKIYVPDKPERRAVEQKKRPQRTRLCRTSPTLVDDYAAQEKLRRQMVMGLGAGCRGASNRPKKKPPVSVSPRSQAAFRLSAQRTPALFDEFTNAEFVDRNRTVSKPRGTTSSVSKVPPFRPGGSRAASRYTGVAGTAIRAGRAPDSEPKTDGHSPFGAIKHAGVEISPHTTGRERTRGESQTSREIAAQRGPWRGPWRSKTNRATVA